MQLLAFYHRHRLHRLASHPDLHRFELAIWLHTLARSLIAIFVPVLLVQTGYSITQVMVYYLVYNAIDVPLNLLAGRLVRGIGARWVLILSTLVTMAFFGLLGALPPGHWPLLMVLALLAALYDTFFWVAHIYIFIEANREGLDTGETAGALEGVRKLASIVGPAVGAFFLVGSGKLTLALVSIAIFALSMLPLFRLRGIADKPTEKRLPLRDFFREPQERRDYLSMALFGVHDDVNGVLWPLFIFLVLGTFGAVAAIPIIIAATSVVFSYAVGKLTRKYHFRMMMIGSAFVGCLWLLRLVIHDPTFYYITVFLMGLLSLMVNIPLDGSIAARALRIGSLSAAIYRNTAGMFMHVILYGILALAVGVFNLSFVLAALGVFLLLAVNTVFLRVRATPNAAQALPSRVQ